MITQKPIEFWIAVGVAVIVKIKTSQRITPVQALMTIAVSVGAIKALKPTEGVLASIARAKITK